MPPVFNVNNYVAKQRGEKILILLHFLLNSPQCVILLSRYMFDLIRENHQLKLLIKAIIGIRNFVTKRGAIILKRIPWNKDKAVGQKDVLTPREVTKIKEALAARGLARDLVLFSVGLDTMLRSCDLRTLRACDVLNAQGTPRGKIPIIQRKTRYSHLVALQNETQRLVREWVMSNKKSPDSYLFTGRKRTGLPISHGQYANLVKQWVAYIGLSPDDYSTHSIRRTKAWLVYKKTKNLEIVRQLLGQKSITSTIHYLNVKRKEALEEGLKIKL